MTPVETALRRRIAEEGPISWGAVMAAANAHYYATRDPFGRGGDFITAPEMSQIFGELIGLWSAVMWAMMGRPTPVRLVELGPGRGTLMADLLRGLGVAPEFRDAVDLHLVETSPVLRESQKRLLEARGASPTWHDRLDTVPDGPAIIIANEFFDALPVRHFVRAASGWHERVVGLNEGGELVFGLTPFPSPDAAIHASLRDSAPGTVVETSPDTVSVAARIAERIARHGGAALMIDYGYERTGAGETLQALKNHQFQNPLDDLGEADLTAHVDFETLGAVGRRAGATVCGPVTQHEFLFQLGIMERLAVLRQKADPDQAFALESGVTRLMQQGATGMGTLFKVLAFTGPGLPTPPGFATLMP